MFRNRKKAKPRPEKQIKVTESNPTPAIHVTFDGIRLVHFHSEDLSKHGWFLTSMGTYVQPDDLRKIADELDRQAKGQEEGMKTERVWGF